MIKYIKAFQTNNINVPQTPSLELEKVPAFTRSKFDLDNYLPKYRKYRLPNKIWIINLSKNHDFYFLIFTKLRNKFKEFVTVAMQKRKKLLYWERWWPQIFFLEFKNIFKKSNRYQQVARFFISLTYQGRSHYFYQIHQVKGRKLKKIGKLLCSRLRKIIKIQSFRRKLRS